ncbi:MAG: AMP-binding protein [Pseudomonadota bacterium]
MTAPLLTGAWRRAGSAGRRPFLVTPDRSLGYADLCRGVTRFCALFDRAGLAPGDRVLIVSDAEHAAATAHIAALLDGIVPVMLTPDSGAPRIAAIAASTEPGLILCDAARAGEPWASGATTLAEGWPAASGMLARLRRNPSAPAAEPVSSAFEPFAEGTRRDPRLPDAPGALGYLLFTSGTTGTPNGVEITRRNIEAHLETLVRVFEHGPDSRIFNATPLGHTDGLVQGPLLAFAAGGAVLRPGRFALAALEDWLNRISAIGATHMITNPAVLGFIDRFAAHDDYFEPAGFDGVVSSAAILRPDLWERFETRFRTRIFNIYGMTETVANATYAGGRAGMGAHGTIGCPIDCETRIAPLPEGPSDGSGELQLRGDNICRGYWRNPERTARAFTADGWFRTGDIARRRADGSLELLGRLSTAINAAGTMIRPEEIDEALLEHPLVVEAATVGLPDPTHGEIAVSAVVTARPVEPNEPALFEHCRARLEALRMPRHIVPLDRIPRGDAGKPQIAALRAALASAIGSTPALDGAETGEADRDALTKVIEIAADVFRVSPETLDARSSPDSITAWDSFTHINLMIAVEQALDCRLPTRRIVAIRSLADLADVVARAD